MPQITISIAGQSRTVNVSVENITAFNEMRGELSAVDFVIQKIKEDLRVYRKNNFHDATVNPGIESIDQSIDQDFS